MPTILLTGGTGGLGPAVVQTLLQHGHTVIATVRSGHTESIRHERLFFRELDLTDETACRSLVEKLPDEYGTLDAAVLLAGGFTMGSLAETDFAAIQQQIEINFKTAYQMVRPVFEQMTKQESGGRFILIGARPALDAGAAQHMVAYSLSKALLLNLSEIINAAGRNKNIISSVIVPGTIDTPANQEAMPGADTQKWVRPEAIAELIQAVVFGPGRLLRESVLKIDSPN